MAKCDLCGNKLDMIFLNKIMGTYVKVNRKTRTVCSNCQSKFSIDELKEKIK
ncbi:hypothetical protein J4214_00300 [Candidatus Woesearchaeota archaeon]|nr:hypothetical protein [Candidatus Woesearchaeota archaeon]